LHILHPLALALEAKTEILFKILIKLGSIIKIEFNFNWNVYYPVNNRKQKTSQSL